MVCTGINVQCMAGESPYRRTHMKLIIGQWLIVEVNLAYAFEKFGQWECFISLEKDRGPAGKRIIFSTAEKSLRA